MNRFRNAGQGLIELAWVMLLVGLPLTSYPALGMLLKSTVSPLSVLPAFVLVVFWLIPYLLRRGNLPLESKPLFAFLFAAVAASAGAFFIAIPQVRNITILITEQRAFLSLGIGLAFYLLFSAWPKTTGHLADLLRWIHIGGAILVVWGSLQGAFILLQADQYPGWMHQIQALLVVLSPNFIPGAGRVVGFTYEPSWLAHQLVLCYLPLWLAATYLRKSAFHFRFFHLSIENILLTAGLFVFYLCSPRISLVSGGLIGILCGIKWGKAISSSLSRLIPKSRDFLLTNQGTKFVLFRLMVSVLLIGIIGLALAGLIYLTSQRDWRLALVTSSLPQADEMKNVLRLDENTILALSNRYAFLERAVFWATGWRVFNLYPWLGVGLGNAGYFAVDQMPALGWASDEIRLMLTDANTIPSMKSLWIRVLAETGLVGIGAMLSWLYLLWRSTRYSGRGEHSVQKVLALAGEFFLIAFIGEGLSLDYFAMPYVWVMAGLLSANGLVYRKELGLRKMG